ncbi:apoptosis-inducing factor 2 [Microdochium nivale]|nr:apoptosis-inducing factor 2 [Microdochium nivale]
MADSKFAEKAWIEFKNIKALQRPNVHFVQGRLSNVDCVNKTATIIQRRGQTIEKTRTETYDYFLAATGLRRPWPVVPQALTRDEYLEETSRHITSVYSNTAPVLVVGGGAVGIEMAAELKTVRPELHVVLAHSRSKLMSAEPIPDSARECVYDALIRGGVEVLLNHRLKEQTPTTTASGAPAYQVEFDGGETMVASEVMFAVSKSVPSTEFLPAQALSDEGYINVEPSMQFRPVPAAASGCLPEAAARCHFAAGDVKHWSGIKRCGSAMHTGKYAGINMYQLMTQDVTGKEPSLLTLDPVPPMIAIAVGKEAMAYGPEGMSHGPQIMRSYFEDDLGLRICWDHMRLGEVKV